jgi:hypothetical protein
VCVHIRRDPRLRGQRRLAGLDFVRGLAPDGSWDMVRLVSAHQLEKLVGDRTSATLAGSDTRLGPAALRA